MLLSLLVVLWGPSLVPGTEEGLKPPAARVAALESGLVDSTASISGAEASTSLVGRMTGGPQQSSVPAEITALPVKQAGRVSQRSEREETTRFVTQMKSECHFADGARGEIYYLERYIYGLEEILRFDTHRREYEAVTELGSAVAQYWNSLKEVMDFKQASPVDFCLRNYQILQNFLRKREAQPTVKISATKGDSSHHHTLLICTAAGYYPSEIKIEWLKNGQEQTKRVGYAEELQNGDWTFQNQAMLETVPQRGDIYACQVEHRSLTEPIIVQWKPQTSDSAKSKMWMGAVGALLGLAFVAVGLSLYLKNRKVLIH
ncbi:H-2 class II histocompatibility antigen, E-S beta chain-like [Eublepharis macularius]|uniref:H-2 class II histocompatibility antigen, E-S beta chain-like n=1 Tax=Eublepharis macularius TaxID=481883 RepID=A0AA97J793_EUBMA|nr:H-2 class II histocompatibility antigen, E-S beta chain-like [Eublepharis macularius]